MGNELVVMDESKEVMPVQDRQAMQQVNNLMLNTKQLALINRFAERYANSSMVPDSYRNKPDNCFVACELAARMNVSPILVMQNLYIVQGKPSWAGQACKALIDGCGKFTQSEYVFIGAAGSSDWGCYLQAKSQMTGKVIKGTTVTWQMALNEGWINKSGSKWKTMPEQMLKYRAAAFFARTECPEVLMGYSTMDEVEDIAKPETVTVVL